MIGKLKKYLDTIVQLPDEEFMAIASVISEKKIRKKEHLIQANEICNKVVFFFDGYFRFYHNTPNGDEVTSDFYFAPNFVTSYTSFLSGKPSFVNVQAMEDMDILEINKRDLNNLYAQYHHLEHLGRLLAENVTVNSESHLFLMLNQTAEERYKSLLDKYPFFIQKIPLQYIASYLGITQETLSRMRKKLK